MNLRNYINNHSRHPGFLAVISIFILLIWVCTFETSAKTGSFDYSLVLDSSQLYEVTEVGGDGETYSKILWDDMISEGEPGAPELPVKYLKFFIPTYCKNLRVELKTAIIDDVITLSHTLFPVQEPQPLNQTEIVWTAPKTELYAVSSESQLLSVCEDSFLDGFNHVVTVAVKPVVYPGDDHTLTVYGNLSFTVSYDECGENDMAIRPIIPKCYRPYFSNDKGILDPLGIKSLNARRAMIDQTHPEFAKEYYYVIVPENLKEAMSDFVTWKSQKGYKVELKTIEEIISDSVMPVDPIKTVYGNILVDEAASLRAYLTQEFKEHGFFHCLLVGNYKTSMPIRKLFSSLLEFQSSDHGNDHAEALVPSDLYFTDLESNYDLTKKYDMSIYHAPVPSGFNPCIAVGRLLCSSPEEIENWFYKLRLYEANPGYGDNDYLDDTLFFEQYKTPKGSLIGFSKPVREQLSEYLNCKYIQDYNSINPSQYGPTGSTMIQEINKVGLSHWYGHGNPAGITVSNADYYMTSEDSVFNLIRAKAYIINEDGNGLDNLKNLNKPSVVYSVSCDNAPFDYLVYSDGYSWKCRYNLAEAFTVANKKGGPLFLGNTRSGLLPAAAEVEQKFFEKIIQNKKVGYAENYSKSYYKNLHTRATHSIIGDPEMELWMGKPEELGVYVLYFNNQIYLEGENLAGSMLSLYDGNGHSVISEIGPDKTFFSLNDIPLEEFDTKNVVVSVWKSGYLPVIKLIGINSRETKNKKYIVRDAQLGYSTFGGTSDGYFIEAGANVTVKAIDEISVRNSFVVENGGTVELECDNHIILYGGTVKNGGTLKVTGKTIVISEDFKVEKGGTLVLSQL